MSTETQNTALNICFASEHGDVIPSLINGVHITFGPGVVNSVDQNLLKALFRIIRPNIVQGATLCSIYISSAKDQHTTPSRHVQGKGKAVDISRINGLKMAEHYSCNMTAMLVTDAIQTQFEECDYRRENFGPLFHKKHGKTFPVKGHNDHIHLSVD